MGQVLKVDKEIDFVVEQACECCFERAAIAMVYDKKTKTWLFCCEECHPNSYEVHFSRLDDGRPDWVAHLSEKNWFDIDKFLPRYLWAKKFYKK